MKEFLNLRLGTLLLFLLAKETSSHPSPLNENKLSEINTIPGRNEPDPTTLTKDSTTVSKTNHPTNLFF